MADIQPPKKFHPEPYPYHHELELEIESLSNSGEGIARDNGWVIFVPFALPGDRVKARVWRNDKNCSSADLVEVLTPSVDRVEPQCRLFGFCGGCQYQHLSYDKQLEWKTRQVADLLRLQAGLTLDVKPAIASPVRYHYRSKITPHFDKPKNSQAGLGPIGFLRVGSRRDIVDVPQCEIALECINEALPQVRKNYQKAASQFKKGATILMRASEGTVITNNGSIASEKVGNLEFHFLAGDFFQNNPYILPLFTSYVADEASSGGEEYLVDAYCGSGLFALTLASRFKKVLGVEVSESSADWARSNARTNGIDHAEFLAADASAIFEQVTFPSGKTAVVIDPPRKGCDLNFLTQLFAFAPAKVVYVSCNPSTQIRDLAEFDKAGYRVTSVQPFDLSPQTKHLECVVTLVRA